MRSCVDNSGTWRKEQRRAGSVLTSSGPEASASGVLLSVREVGTHDLPVLSSVTNPNLNYFTST